MICYDNLMKSILYYFPSGNFKTLLPIDLVELSHLFHWFQFKRDAFVKRKSCKPSRFADLRSSKLHKCRCRSWTPRVIVFLWRIWYTKECCYIWLCNENCYDWFATFSHIGIRQRKEFFAIVRNNLLSRTAFDSESVTFLH